MTLDTSQSALRGAQQIFNVGFDLGTASTKIVVQDVIDRKAKPVVLRLGNSTAGFCAAATPTTVAISDGKFTFGTVAEQADSGAIVLRSLKVCTACQYGALTCRGCAYRSPDCLPRRGGLFSIPTQAGPIRLVAQDALALYVGWARGEVLRQLRTLYQGVDPSQTLWNVSVPLGQMDDSAMKDAYSVLIATAFELGDFVEQGVEVAPALARLRDAKRNVTEQPGLQKLGVTLVPETLAAIQGYINLPTTKLGLYGIVDVGAGTTDVSFFDLYDRAERKVTYYGADAKAVGGDDIDLAVASALLDGRVQLPLDRERLASVASAVHTARASGSSTCVVGSTRYDLATSSVGTAEQEIATRVWNAAHDVFERAYIDKLRNTGYWTQLPLLLVGGGSRNARVEKGFGRMLCPYTETQPVTRVTTTKPLSPGPGLTRADVEASRDFVLVAYGLSFPEPEHPQFQRPSEVPDFKKPPETERFDANDMYGK